MGMAEPVVAAGVFEGRSKSAAQDQPDERSTASLSAMAETP